MESVRKSLWNEDFFEDPRSGSGETYQQILIEQYKICIEMADRVSARRSVANTFFLSLNTLVVTVLTAVLKGQQGQFSFFALFPGFLILLISCLAWYMMVRSYRLLNGAKFLVIGALEERLPASPYWRAEWAALGEGKNWRLYLPLSHIEQWVPLAFAASYLAGFIALM
ncbi:hypothetical protein [Nocardiopsis sp. NPDC057823]|uniref:RipA family octameric membrane protein n=1 Tax=Nocardiopsis sp. NPDC057823 TaxID=3346256 RepID=UPI00366C2FA2